MSVVIPMPRGHETPGMHGLFYVEGDSIPRHIGRETEAPVPWVGLVHGVCPGCVRTAMSLPWCCGVVLEGVVWCSD